MGLRLSSDIRIGTIVRVHELGKLGQVVDNPSPFSLSVQVGPCEYLVSTSGVTVVSAERPYEDAPREVLERQLMRQAAQIAGMLSEAEGMTQLISTQMEMIADLQTTTRALPAGGAKATPHSLEEFAWYTTLVAKLETYLSQQCGSRAPLHISDVALRELVSHILD